MSTTRMLILGVVRGYQPVHGYDVRRELLSWHADEWANIAPGSVYHALKKLAEEGLLREVSTEQVGGRPARTMYEITSKGETEFQDLLRRYWWEYQAPTNPFTAAYAFLPVLPPAEGVAALRNRARMLRLTADGDEVRMTSVYADEPSHVLELFRLDMDRARLEAHWCERVADRLEAGDLPMPDWTGIRAADAAGAGNRAAGSTAPGGPVRDAAASGDPVADAAPSSSPGANTDAAPSGPAAGRRDASAPGDPAPATVADAT